MNKLREDWSDLDFAGAGDGEARPIGRMPSQMIAGIQECMKATEARYPIIEESVARQILQRRQHGLTKYGIGLERRDLTTQQWLQHAKEEAMDLSVYLERTQQSIQERENELLGFAEKILQMNRSLLQTIQSPFYEGNFPLEGFRTAHERNEKTFIELTAKPV